VSDLIIIDNPNTSAIEISPYILASAGFRINARVVEIICDPDVAFHRQQLKVPKDVFIQMAKNMSQPLPTSWPLSIINGMARPPWISPSDVFKAADQT